jgi:hypothetical protein
MEELPSCANVRSPPRVKYLQYSPTRIPKLGAPPGALLAIFGCGIAIRPRQLGEMRAAIP